MNIKFIKSSKSRAYSLIQCLNDGRCHPIQLFFVFIKSLQNFSPICFPNFLQNTTDIPNSMGMGHVPKMIEKITGVCNACM